MAYISRIRVENCRNVRELEIDLDAAVPEEGAEASEQARPPFRHLILTGRNGSGKSGVLKSVAACLRESLRMQAPRLGTVVDQILQTIEEPAVADENLGAIRLTCAPIKGRPLVLSKSNGPIDTSILRLSHEELKERFASGAVIALYLPARRTLHQQQVRGPSAMPLKAADLPPTAELSPYLLQFLVNRHTEMAYAQAEGDSEVAERIRLWFGRLWDRIKTLMEDPGLDIKYDRRAFNFTFTRSDGYTFDLSSLADGHAAALALLAEILVRIDVAQQARGDLTFEPEGVVVVDEIETHLHLSLQEQILPLVTTMFPRLQFIVATHSPAVIASIPGAVVYDLGKKTQRLSDAYRGIPYGILMTEHFGISSDIDLDSTRKLLRFRELAKQPARSPVEEQEMRELGAELSGRSEVLATEVWMVEERLGTSNVQLAGE